MERIEAMMSKSSSRIKRSALLVLGMHRSGTSALSGVLAKLGAETPKTLMPPTADNPKGYWESAAIMEFNNAILASAGSRWDEWEAFNREWLRTASGQAAMSKLPGLLEQEFGDAPLFLIKDPRICRLLPAWLQAMESMGLAVKIVIPVRNPIEVARSLEARNKLTRLQALLIWLRHVLDSEHASRGQDRAFVRYADLLADWRSETSRVAKVLGIEWPRMSGRTETEVDDYLDRTLKHHTAEQKLPTGNVILSWVSETYGVHCDLADGRDGKSARDRLDAVREAFDACSGAFAPLFHEVRMDLTNRLEARSRDLASVSAEAKELRVENASLKQQRASDEAAVVKQESELEALKKELVSRDAALHELEAKHLSTREDLVVARSELASVTTTLQGQVGALQQERADFRLQAEGLIGKLEAAEAHASEAASERSRTAEDLLNRLAAAESRAREAAAERSRIEKDLLDRLAVTESRAREAVLERSREKALHQERIAALNDRLCEQINDIEGRRLEAEGLAKERLAEVVALSKRVLELESAVSAGQSTAGALRTELEKCRALHGEQAAGLAAGKRMMEEQDRRIRGLAAEVSAQSAVVAGYRQALDAIRSRGPWTMPGELRQVAGVAIGTGREEPSAGEVESRLRKSKLFDADWYLARYPDVRKRKVDPVRHYLRHGAKEGRDPGPVFSTKGYTASNPDVAAAGVNPLEHYLLYGRKEGRSIVTGDSKSGQEGVKP